MRTPVIFTRHLLLLISLSLLAACGTPALEPQPPTEESLDVQPVLFGAFTRGDINLDTEAVAALEQDLDHPLDIVQWFTNFDHPWEAKVVATASQNGRIPMITWQPTGHPLDDIISGKEDAYLRRWARGAAAHGTPIYIRLMPEMNGYWVPWSGDAEKFKTAWRHIVDLFREEGATNVKWIFAPNCVDEAEASQRDRTEDYQMEKYYPGPDYVDIFGISGFNWGEVPKVHIWRSYDDIFRTPYDRLSAIGPHDFWMVETASAENGGNKADWVRDMFTSKAFPKVTAIIWFNEKKEQDWRVQSSPASLEMFRKVLDATESDREVLALNYLR
jgi:endoglucanase